MPQAQVNSTQADAQPLLFALDIGTRSVIGILGRPEQDGLFHIVDVAVREHTQRAMMDGQIEDIEQVAALAKAVKEELETRQNIVLRQVCVAAAGRALKTIRTTGEISLDDGRAISAQTVYRLEMEAVDKARQMLENETGGAAFYCVGRSVIRYFIDGYPFSKIKGHKGKTAQVEVIVTFLPNEVVESLYATMSLADLCVESMTLEPIAAMNAVIPAELRLLNLALVDVGAGTSDIAISQEGSVAAYAMATTAGDEITESLIHRYLIDFATAESMKQAALDASSKELTYEDILGFGYTVQRSEVLETVRKAAQALAQTIADKILESNGKAPAAVFLVGGGSQTPFLDELVAEALGIDARKVAIGGNNFMKRVVTSEISLEGPEFATPLGIALTAARDESRESFFVAINGKRVLVFASRTMSVLDVLLLCGYRYVDLMGRNGKSLSYKFNEKAFLVRGGLFEPAQIMKNGQAVTLSTQIAAEDTLAVIPAMQGKDAAVCMADLLPPSSRCTLTINQEPHTIFPVVLRGGVPTVPKDLVQDGDVLTCDFQMNLAQACEILGIDVQENKISVAGNAVDLFAKAENGMVLTVEPNEAVAAMAQAKPKPILEAMQEPAVEVLAFSTFVGEQEQENIPEISSQYAVEVQFAEMPHPQMHEPAPLSQVMVETIVPRETLLESKPQALPLAVTEHVPSAPMQPQTFAPPEEIPLVLSSAQDNHRKSLRLTLNEQIHAFPKRETPYQFMELLDLVDLDYKNPKGNIILQRNGHAASYLELLEDGDEIVITWEE